MAYTTVQEYLGDPTTTPAERKLIAACQAGEPCTLGNGTLPPERNPDPQRHIRAELLHLLILGGTPDCGPSRKMFMLCGAHIDGDLDLSSGPSYRQIFLLDCRFDGEIFAPYVSLEVLSLKGSHVLGLNLQGSDIVGSLFLSEKFHSTQTVSVAGAKIGGQIDCSDSRFDGGASEENSPLIAMFAQGLKLGGSLSLANSHFSGTVNLSGAKIGGQLAIHQTTLDGKTGKALLGQSMSIGQGLIWVENDVKSGAVDLSAASISDLCDDIDNWPIEPERLLLDGFTYVRFSGPSPVTLAARKDWLARGSRSNNTFNPQPYTQFAKALREIGHASEARKVLMERDRLLFVESHKTNLADVKAARAKHWGYAFMALLRYSRLWLWDSFSRKGSGYGHAPQFALYWSLFWVGIGGLVFSYAWQAGVMVPNSAIILTSSDWLAAMQTSPNHPSAIWTTLAPGQHFETFYALPYALDVFVPFLSLGQESAWAATTVGTFGKIIRWFTFAYQIIGWAITALGIAAITGFVQKNQPD